MNQYDVVVIGAGQIGRKIATELCQKHKKVAIISLNDDSATLFERLIQTLATGTLAEEPIPHGPENVDTFRGNPTFRSKEKIIHVGDEPLSAKNFVVATGAIPVIPKIQGLNEIPHFFPMALLSRSPLPKDVVIFGDGPIAICLAMHLSKQGCQPTLISTHSRLLPKEEKEVSIFYSNSLQEMGIRIELEATHFQTRKLENEKISVALENKYGQHEILTDAVTFATGFKSHSRGFGLEEQKVYINGEDRLMVNDQMQTSASHIWAAGLVSGPPFNSALAEHQSHLVVNNLTSPFFSQIRMEPEPFPSINPCDPPLARIGIGEEEARKAHKDCLTHTTDITHPSGKTKGLIKIIGKRRSGQLLGVHIVGVEAGSMVAFFNLAMRAEIPLFDLMEKQHYPSPSQMDEAFQCIETWLNKAAN